MAERRFRFSGAGSLRPVAIFNRRNAFLGWLSWIVAKRVLKQKARDAVPGTAEGSRWPNKAAIAAALAAVGGLIWFWRRTAADELPRSELPPPAGE